MARREGGSSGRCRSRAHAATAAATPATTQPSHETADLQAARGRPVGRASGIVAIGVWCVAAPARASPNSFAEPQRSAGSFWSAVWIAASAAGGTLGRLARSGGGCSVRTLATMAWELGPVNGGSPASISNVIAPSA